MTDQEQIKKKVQDIFAKHAEKYVTSTIHAKGTDLPMLAEWLQPSEDWAVIDIATGGGHVTKVLAPHVLQIFATDLTLEMLNTARNHLSQYCNNVSYVRADAEALPFLDHTFDAAVCRIAAHHFPNPEAFVSEVSRVLKPGGKFILIDNVAPEQTELDHFMNTVEKLRDESHGRCYTIPEWTEWFHQHGLTITKSLNRRKTFEFPTWVRRTASSEEQVQVVENYILQAPEPVHQYFSVTLQDGKIQSHQIDEWMVQVEKGLK